MKPVASSLRTDINITPLIDIVLVLLIVFIVMVPTMGYAQRAQSAGEGRGAGKVADLPKVQVLGEGRYGFEGETLNGPDLVQRLVLKLREQPMDDRKVVLRIAPEARLGVASAAMDLVHQAAGRLGDVRLVRAVLVEDADSLQHPGSRSEPGRQGL